MGEVDLLLTGLVIGREKKTEVRTSRIALIPYLQAESDRL